MRILLIDDDQRLTRLITSVLEEEGYRVDAAHDGEMGLEMALTGVHGVMVVDWMLPSRDGPAITRAIRHAKLLTPILILTARSQVEDRVVGLDNGADDYLVKPFALVELLARIRALARRTLQTVTDPSELRCGDITLDLHGHTARRGNLALNLTSTEWEMLECLMRHPGQALTREQIFDQVWAFDSKAQLSMVDVYVSYLRRKLKTQQQPDNPIETVRGVGYRLVVK
ncbi:MAG: response regulator transcription factor [Anaerolineae bacterium]|nr:response regulator transcription factor [Anaerolineae bacterium]